MSDNRFYFKKDSLLAITVPGNFYKLEKKASGIIKPKFNLEFLKTQNNFIYRFADYLHVEMPEDDEITFLVEPRNFNREDKDFFRFKPLGFSIYVSLVMKCPFNIPKTVGTFGRPVDYDFPLEFCFPKGSNILIEVFDRGDPPDHLLWSKQDMSDVKDFLLFKLAYYEKKYHELPWWKRMLGWFGGDEAFPPDK